MGAEAIRELLDAHRPVHLRGAARGTRKTGSKQKIKDLSKRLRIVEALRDSDNDPSGW
jgi:DNA-directed RNA polymerase subunit beta'